MTTLNTPSKGPKDVAKSVGRLINEQLIKLNIDAQVCDDTVMDIADQFVHQNRLLEARNKDATKQAHSKQIALLVSLLNKKRPIFRARKVTPSGEVLENVRPRDINEQVAVRLLLRLTKIGAKNGDFRYVKDLQCHNSDDCQAGRCFDGYYNRVFPDYEDKEKEGAFNFHYMVHTFVNEHMSPATLALLVDQYLYAACMQTKNSASEQPPNS